MLELDNQRMTESEIIQQDISQEVLKRRCLLRDRDGNIAETPDQMYWRVAKSVAEAEANYQPNPDECRATRRFAERLLCIARQ